jgi:hypothetical protein
MCHTVEMRPSIKAQETLTSVPPMKILEGRGVISPISRSCQLRIRNYQEQILDICVKFEVLLTLDIDIIESRTAIFIVVTMRISLESLHEIQKGLSRMGIALVALLVR